jgi:hypothetical protein
VRILDGPTFVELDVDARRPPSFSQFLPEYSHARLRVGVARRKWHQHANAPHALALLRAPRAAM